MSENLWTFGDNDLAYLAGAKVGTEVIIYSDSWGLSLRRTVVTKETRTQIEISRERFWRKNGKKVGDHDTYHVYRVFAATTARVQAAVEWRKRQNLRTEREELQETIKHELYGANLATLQAILAILHDKPKGEAS